MPTALQEPRAVANLAECPAEGTNIYGRLKKLEQLGLAEERRAGVWSLDPKLESKLRQLGERADTFKMMQRALKQAGIERPAPGLALFEGGRRRTPVIAKVVAVGLVDEITDRQYVIVDGTDGRVHYAEQGQSWILKGRPSLKEALMLQRVSDGSPVTF